MSHIRHLDPLTETINTFDKYAVEYDSKYMSYQPYVETYAPLSDLLAADASILDAACGPGNIARFLLHEFPERRLHGIDLSQKMIDLALINNPTATFDVMDCRDISSLPENYDAIVAGFCFPYLSREEVATFICDARRKLNTGGVLYISFMEGDYAASGLTSRNNIDWLCTYYHTADTVIEALKSTGFDVINLVRKPFEQEDEPTVVDVFIYASTYQK